MAAVLEGLGERPLIMGVLNITPDSFSDGGRFIDPGKALDHADYLVESGADILDIGGESSRPGAQSIPAEEEIGRVVPIIEKLAKAIEIPISIDTVKAGVAERAFGAGASILNDISALRSDPEMAGVVAKNNGYVVLMHMRGSPGDMQENTEYEDIIGEISGFLSESAVRAVGQGIAGERIIIDPGIGFGKSAQGNFVILKNLDKFLKLGYPVLVGASRKSFIGKSLAVETDQRLEGSIAAACYAVLNGAAIVRVHDVLETRRAITIIENISAADRA